MKDIIIFDLDGTLADSKRSIFASYRYAAERLGYPCFTDDVLAAHLCGGLPGNAKALFPDGDDWKKAVGLYREHYSAHSKDGVQLFRGTREALEDLRSRGCRLFLATMKIESVAMSSVEDLGISEYFDMVTGADISGGITKTDMILRCAGNEKEDAVMVGDCSQDRHAASEAGVDFIAAAYGYGLPRERCIEEGIAFIDSIGELAHLLKGPSSARARK